MHAGIVRPAMNDASAHRVQLRRIDGSTIEPQNAVDATHKDQVRSGIVEAY
jgi:hypothetical protein